MKRSDISDRDALAACWPWGRPRNDGGALVMLTERIGGVVASPITAGFVRLIREDAADTTEAA